MGETVSAEASIETLQCIDLSGLQRPAIGPSRKGEDRLQVSRFSVDQQTPKLIGTAADGLPHGRERAGIRILGGELPQLLEGIDQLEGILTNVVQLRPEALQFGRLRRSEH